MLTGCCLKNHDLWVNHDSWVNHELIGLILLFPSDVSVKKTIATMLAIQVVVWETGFLRQC